MHVLTFFRNDLVPVLTFCALWQFLVLQSVQMFSFQFRMKCDIIFLSVIQSSQIMASTQKCVSLNSQITFHFTKTKKWKMLTLIMTFLLSLSGDGNSFSSASIGSVNKVSPNISLNACVIFRCCGKLQWFSMDKINGYLEYQDQT